MIESKRINLIVFISMALALIIVTELIVMGNTIDVSAVKSEPAYAAKVFGTGIISIEIMADEDEWQKMLDNAISEEYIMVDVIVNGTKFEKVGIRPKGNSSLSQVARSDSDRYSFRLQFDEYIKGQTCFGLESFILNNMLGDNTYMKEYISFDLMKEAGVDTPYFSFADIKVNGEPWGFYLAIELYNKSYEQRVFGDVSGMLYNVKSMEIGNNNMQQFPGGRWNGEAQPFKRENMENTEIQPFNAGDTGNGGIRPFNPGDMGNSEIMPFNPGNAGNGGMQPFNPGDTGNGQIQPGPTPDNGENSESLPESSNGRGNNDMMPENFPQRGNGRMQFPGMNRGQGMGGMAGRGPGGDNGGSLKYIDDNPESYGAIFNNVVGKGNESDYKRVIEALKALSEGRDLEKYFDVDKILRYLAAHTIVVNLDSYSSGMAQNYYIYEKDGKITILPWDYNLAWGGFQSMDASSVINFPIDTPVSGVEMSERPLLEKLLSNNEYLERYHGYLQNLTDNYFTNGKFEAKVKELDELIKDYVKNDVSSFCTYEDYEKAVSAFITLGNLRAQSIQGQLDGTVPSTTAEQRANPDKLIQAGDLNLQVLGSMMGGGRRAGGRGGRQ